MKYKHLFHASATDGRSVLFIVGCQTGDETRGKVERLIIGEQEYKEMPELVGHITFKISAFLMQNKNNYQSLWVFDSKLNI